MVAGYQLQDTSDSARYKLGLPWLYNRELATAFIVSLRPYGKEAFCCISHTGL